MLISFNWLKTYFDSKSMPSPEEIAALLNQHSYEVEKMLRKDEDVIFDIDVLPNRASDSLSHIGIAREIAALTDSEVVMPEADVTESEEISDLLSLAIDEKICRRAIKRVVSGVQIGPSPDWLVERLRVLGQRSINNVVDITNFVMLETGQPVHAFDYDKIEGEGVKRIEIRKAIDGEKITLLDGEEYELDSTIPVISDDKKALDVAGVKGGDVSAIDENTKRVLLSACSFDPIVIRSAARNLNLRTDASKRFENDVPPSLTGQAMERLSSLIEEIAGGSSSNIIDIYPSPQTPSSITVSVDEINNLLGTSLSSEEIEKILKKLEFSVISMGDGLVVSAPLWRTDISLPVDVIEEVGRIYGYDQIESVLPSKTHAIQHSKAHMYKEKIRDCLVESGFTEAYLYSFVEKGEIEVKNKIASDKGFLRTNLSDGIKAALEQNSTWAPVFEKSVLKIFEIGTVFDESREYTAISLGVKNTEKTKKTPDSHIEEALNKLRNEGIPLEGEIVDGVVEIILDEIIEALPEAKDLSLVEIDDSELSFSPISQYPFVLRDVAVWAPSNVEEEEVGKIIKKEAGELLVKTSCFDVYKKDERISYAFNLVFQSPEKTLSDTEVNKIMEKVYARLGEAEGWEIR